MWYIVTGVGMLLRSLCSNGCQSDAKQLYCTMKHKMIHLVDSYLYLFCFMYLDCLSVAVRRWCVSICVCVAVMTTWVPTSSVCVLCLCLNFFRVPFEKLPSNLRSTEIWTYNNKGRRLSQRRNPLWLPQASIVSSSGWRTLTNCHWCLSGPCNLPLHFPDSHRATLRKK